MRFGGVNNPQVLALVIHSPHGADGLSGARPGGARAEYGPERFDGYGWRATRDRVSFVRIYREVIRMAAEVSCAAEFGCDRLGFVSGVEDHQDAGR